jgi:hypothetical protein
MRFSRPDTSHSIVIWTAGLASLLPLIVFSHSFHQLYFFHDDWGLLDGAARSNLWEWLFQPFLGESIIPVFKLLWLGAVRLFGGGYFAMICLLWATHLANCLCAVSIAPPVLAALAMYLFVVRHGSGRDLTAALSYGAHYFLLNPLYHLLSIPKKTVGTLALLLYGILKIAVIVWALWKADTRLRPLLLVLVAFDLANAAALGFARFHTGLDTTVSSRYQYLSLFCFGPMAGLLVARPKRLARAAVFLVWIPLLAYPWKRHAPRWAGWRGVEIRERLAEVPDSSHFDPSSVTAGRARELVTLYHLH